MKRNPRLLHTHTHTHTHNPVIENCIVSFAAEVFPPPSIPPLFFLSLSLLPSPPFSFLVLRLPFWEHIDLFRNSLSSAESHVLASLWPPWWKEAGRSLPNLFWRGQSQLVIFLSLNAAALVSVRLCQERWPSLMKCMLSAKYSVACCAFN